MGFLTDGIFKYLLGALSLGLLLGLLQQEFSLRHALSVTNKSLDNEIQCRMGSTCAEKLKAEAARGADLVDQARKAADIASAAQKASLDKQTVEPLRGLQDAAIRANSNALIWKRAYQDALQTPECGTWAKQTRACAIN